MANALDVVGRLAVEMGDDGSARVEARGDTIVVEIPSLRIALATLRRWPGGRGRRAASIGRVHSALVDAGLSLEVVVGATRVGRLGIGARPGLTSRLLGVGPMEIHLGGQKPGPRSAPPEG